MAVSRAVEELNLDEIFSLLVSGVPVDQTDEDGYTGLHTAAKAGNTKALQCLIRAAAYVDVCNKQEETPLMLASSSGHLRAVQLMMEAGADIHSTVAKKKFTCLQRAAGGGFDDIVHLLLEAGVNPEQTNPVLPPALYLASLGGHLPVVDTLLACGVNPSVEWSYLRNQALHGAAQHGHASVVKRLISAGALVNALNDRGWNPLLFAAINGHLGATVSLLCAGADPDIPTESGDCSLHEAAINGRSDVVARLIEAQASIDAVNSAGETALLRAAQGGHELVLKRLIAASAMLDVASNSGETPLIVAARDGHEFMVSALLKAGAVRPNRGGNGGCALSLAAQNGYYRIVRLLLNRDLDEQCFPYTQVKKALNAAKLFGRQKVVAVISQYLSSEYPTMDSHFKNLDMAFADSWPADFLPKQPWQSDEEISLRLHQSMLNAGFNRSRALVRSASADAVEQRINELPGVAKYFVVGSVSDGWGNSLISMSGGTDTDSDIDVTQIQTTSVYHLRRWCICQDQTEQERYEYSDGHLISEGQSGNPAHLEPGSSVRPTLELINADKCCCYPEIPLLKLGCRTNIPDSAIKLLKNELRTTTCHVVRAAAPGLEGRQLRVSTSFLERRLMRTLSTIQGQLFVILKYLFKKVLSRKAFGFKTYNAKTLLFRMLHETPADKWRPENLVHLVKRGLNCVAEDLFDPCLTEHQSTWHFFLPDAAVYLRSGHAPKDRLGQEIERTQERLPKILGKFESKLRKLSDSNTFQLHLLLLFPHGFGLVAFGRAKTDLGEIFYSIRDLLQAVANGSGQELELLSRINDLSESASSAKRTLWLLMLLSTRTDHDRAKAERFLRDNWGSSTVRGLTVGSDCELTPGEAFSMVQRHMVSGDAFTKFCFTYMSNPPSLQIPTLPFVSEIFPKRLRNFQGRQVFVNFDAMLRAIGMEAFGLDGTSWFAELIEEEADVQELQVALRFCQDSVQISRLISRHLRVIASDAKLSATALRVLQSQS